LKTDGIVVAVLPAFNESKYIQDVIQRTRPHVDKVVVANDNSNDNTYQMASLEGALMTTHHTKFRGAGRNTWRGIWLALRLGADVIVTLDGDGQHRPEQIPDLLDKLRKSNASIVVGSRFQSDIEKMPRYRRFGNNIINWLHNCGAEHKLTDTQCGFRAYQAEVFQEVRISEDGFNFADEVLIKARAAGFTIAEVPVDCVYHADFADNSSQNALRHGLKVALGTIKWRLKERI